MKTLINRGNSQICASKVSDVLDKSGMFPGVNSTVFPGNLKFPDACNPQTQKIDPSKR